MAPEQPQSSARPIRHFHIMTNTCANQRPDALLHMGACCATHYAKEDDTHYKATKLLLRYEYIYTWS